MNEKDEDFEALPLQVQLSAYLDNELPEPLLRQLRLRLRDDKSLNETLAQLRRGNEFGDRLFASLLKDPVPLEFARAIKYSRAG